ncbi:MAG: hypothetical protein KIT83_06670, partial [Bryobacterales bacterium]|nr:hypothetical protein [Bryobacterales bacterium]
MAEFPFQLREGGNAQRVRVHLSEILRSPSFVNAPQLRSFLEFLVEGVLEGRDDELKEANLGRDVFRRGSGYDPRSDAIVRVQASILRKRLTSYYEEEGKASPIRIVLPKGCYVPQVECPATESSSENAELSADRLDNVASPDAIVASSAAALSQPTRRGLIGTALSFAAGLAVASGGYMARDAFRGTRGGAITRSATAFDAKEVSPRIWGQLLQPDLPVQLAFGCPQFFNGDGVYIRDVNVNDTGGESNARLQQLSQQLQRYLAPVPNTYTGVGEMRGIHHITRFLAYGGIDAGFENAQLLTLEAIQGKTLILVASHRFRTLLDLLELPKKITSSFENGG